MAARDLDRLQICDVLKSPARGRLNKRRNIRVNLLDNMRVGNKYTRSQQNQEVLKQREQAARLSTRSVGSMGFKPNLKLRVGRRSHCLGQA